MKLNYKKSNGMRTTIIISDALVDAWASAHDFETQESLIDALRIAVETTPEPKTGQTTVSVVESFLLADIRDKLAELKLKIARDLPPRPVLR